MGHLDEELQKNPEMDVERVRAAVVLESMFEALGDLRSSFLLSPKVTNEDGSPKDKRFLYAIQAPDGQWFYPECVVPETVVMMADGSGREIRYISVGEKVMNHKGEPEEVVAVHQFPAAKEMVSIIAANSNIPVVSTNDHPYLIRRYGGEINWHGDRNGTFAEKGVYATRLFAEESFVLARELKHRDFLITPIPLEVRPTDYDDDFFYLSWFLSCGRWIKRASSF